jgi:hypothetical protein
MAENGNIDDLLGDDTEPPGVVAGMTHDERVDEFFRLLKAGCTVRQAASAVAVAFTVLYRRRKADAAFAKRWEDAQRISVGHLTAEAERRAMRGSDKLLIFLLQSYDPARFRHQSTLDVTNSDGSLTPIEDGDRASRAAALLAMAAARKSSQAVADLL